MAEEKEIFGEWYSFRRLSARDQLPLFLRVMRAIKAAGNEEASIMDLFTTMSDDDARAVFDRVLPTITRKQGQNWVPITNGTGMMFDDLDDIMIQITLVAAALEANFKNFSSAASPSSPSGNQSPG